jgi:DNA-binding transcriptional regulator YiaG
MGIKEKDTMAPSQDSSNQGNPRSRGKKTSSKKVRQAQIPNIIDSSGKPPADAQPRKPPTSIPDRPTTNPNLFANQSTSRMASALPIWEASNILTQRHHLPWSSDADGKLCYAKDVGDGQGAIHFWVTENLEDEFPVPLAGAAALAVVDAFDIRAACMHLIYAASAAQLDRPWEKELIIDDRQIESYLGLKKRTDMNRQEKLALIEEIAKQPCKITTFISWPTQGKVKGFTLEEGRLWHLMGIRYHYQQDLLGEKELTGMTFIVKAGLWAKYFLNEEGKKSKTALYQSGLLPKALLEAVMSVWQHREGAARLMVWLLFKAQFNRQYPLNVQALMEVAYGVEKIEQARQNSELRKKLANSWDEDLMTLHDRGWKLNFDLETYPLSIQPTGFGRGTVQRPRGFFEQLLAARLWIVPEDALLQEASLHSSEDHRLNPPPQTSNHQPLMILTGGQVRAMRIAKGWSQRKLATLTGMSQGLISLIENEERSITSENEAILSKIFESNP